MASSYPSTSKASQNQEPTPKNDNHSDDDSGGEEESSGEDSDEPIHVCGICKAKQPSKSDLTDHMKLAHPMIHQQSGKKEKSRVCCGLCPQYFHTIYGYVQHMADAHDVPREKILKNGNVSHY